MSSYISNKNLVGGSYNTLNVESLVVGDLIVQDISTEDIIPKINNTFSIGSSLLKYLRGYFTTLNTDYINPLTSAGILFGGTTQIVNQPADSSGPYNTILFNSTGTSYIRRDTSEDDIQIYGPTTAKILSDNGILCGVNGSAQLYINSSDVDFYVKLQPVSTNSIDIGTTSKYFNTGFLNHLICNDAKINGLGLGILHSDSSGNITSSAVIASDIDAESSTLGQVLTSDGSGIVSWQTPSSSSTNADNILVGPGVSGNYFMLMSRPSTGYNPVSIDYTKLYYNYSTSTLYSDFFAGNLSGTAGIASTVSLVAGTNTTNYLVFAESATGNIALKTDTGLTFDASTNALSCDRLLLAAGTLTNPAIYNSTYNAGIYFSGSNRLNIAANGNLTMAFLGANGIISYYRFYPNVDNSIDCGRSTFRWANSYQVNCRTDNLIANTSNISMTANLNPASNTTYDLGTTSLRYNNIYANDLYLKAETDVFYETNSTTTSTLMYIGATLVSTDFPTKKLYFTRVGKTITMNLYYEFTRFNSVPASGDMFFDGFGFIPGTTIGHDQILNAVVISDNIAMPSNTSIQAVIKASSTDQFYILVSDTTVPNSQYMKASYFSTGAGFSYKFYITGSYQVV